ncbi:nitrate regulatory protein [Erwinia tasmaniensis]|nr:nitrate regulatory protein [Erwinia tasmaniensis]
MALSALDFLLASKKSEITGLQQLLQMGKLVGAISQLVHVLQRERGTANIYLCSQGKMWGDRLYGRALKVQQAEQIVHQQLAELDPMNSGLSNASRLFSRIAAFLHSLSTLPLLRKQVQELTIGQPEAMLQYCEAIRTHLALIFEAADASCDPLISRSLLAMFSFMQGKELAGQERALGAAGFAACHFTDRTHQQLLDLIDGQERCFQTFFEFADARCVALWQRQLAHDSSEFERLRRIACTLVTPIGQPQELALRWFELATTRIDGMKQVEERLETILMACCRQRILDAETSRLRQEKEMVLIPPHDNHYPALIPPQLSRSILELVQQQSRQLQAQDAELANLRSTLAERKLVERAKGLLMQHHAMTEPQAHKALREMAMKQNKKLVEIAEAIISVAAVLGKTSL